MNHPTWKDLQKIGCSKIGTVRKGDQQRPVCKECRQQYDWSTFFHEWEHPYQEELNYYLSSQNVKDPESLT